MIEPRGKDQNRKSGREGDELLEFLMAYVANARLFRSPENRYYAPVSIGDRKEILRLDSSLFRDWLIEECRSLQFETPSEAMIRNVVNSLELRARRNRASAPVFLRVGGNGEDAGSTFYLDLGDASGRAVKIRRRMVRDRSTRNPVSSAQGAPAASRAES